MQRILDWTAIALFVCIVLGVPMLFILGVGWQIVTTVSLVAVIVFLAVAYIAGW